MTCIASNGSVHVFRQYATPSIRMFSDHRGYFSGCLLMHLSASQRCITCTILLSLLQSFSIEVLISGISSLEGSALKGGYCHIPYSEPNFLSLSSPSSYRACHTSVGLALLPLSIVRFDIRTSATSLSDLMHISDTVRCYGSDPVRCMDPFPIRYRISFINLFLFV